MLLNINRSEVKSIQAAAYTGAHMVLNLTALIF